MSSGRRITKALASTLLIGGVILALFVSKKETLVAQKMLPEYAMQHGIAMQMFDSNFYGVVLSQDVTAVPGSTIETVALNVPKHANSSKSIVRYGRLVRHENAEATILICHGFMCDKFDVGFLRQMFPAGKYNFMTFDFRAHGECAEGQRCTFGRDEAYDVIAAASFIKNYEPLKDRPCIAYGFSMGAAAAIEAQAKDSSLFSAMVLDCPFDSCENIIKRSLESLKFTFLGYDFTIPACALLQKYAFHPYVQSLIKGILKTVSNLDTKNIETRMYPISPAQSIQKVEIPCFFIHCKNDKTITVKALKSIYDGAASSYKELWLTNGRRHFDSYFYNPEKYIQMIDTFISTILYRDPKALPFKNIVEDPEESVMPIQISLSTQQ